MSHRSQNSQSFARSLNSTAGEALSLESIHHKLRQFSGRQSANDSPVLSEEEVNHILEQVTNELQKNCKAMIDLEPPLIVCGDTHGQYSDLQSLFRNGGWPPNSRYLFLGDYVDRGPFSIETICLMFTLKLQYPNGFFILRGNHETSAINRVYGFYDECKQRYGSGVNLWNKFQEAFNSMPIAALISHRIFCIHGGLSPELHNFNQLQHMTLPFEVSEFGGLACDLLWSDPCPNTVGFVPSSRGVSYLFGPDVVEKFCRDKNIDLICRAHQVMQDGYDFFANRKLITIFSAPNYCGEFNNSAAMLFIDEQLGCKIRQLGKGKRRKRRQ